MNIKSFVSVLAFLFCLLIFLTSCLGLGGINSNQNSQNENDKNEAQLPGEDNAEEEDEIPEIEITPGEGTTPEDDKSPETEVTPGEGTDPEKDDTHGTDLTPGEGTTPEDDKAQGTETAPEDGTPRKLTYEEYAALSPTEQMAYMNSFNSYDDFFAWHREAKEKYDEENALPEIGEDGNIDLGGQ